MMRNEDTNDYKRLNIKVDAVRQEISHPHACNVRGLSDHCAHLGFTY